MALPQQAARRALDGGGRILGPPRPPGDLPPSVGATWEVRKPQNPVSFYYAFEPATGTVDALIAEVTNTPWGERHAYVLDARAARGPGTSPLATVGFAFRKAFHVSPFFPMDLGYRWRFPPPPRERGWPCTWRTGRTASASSTPRSC